MRNQKVNDQSIGFEIKGQSLPRQKRKEQSGNKRDMNIDIPNGDLQQGKIYFSTNCSPCHQLDYDTNLGPALRTLYLRKQGRYHSVQYRELDIDYNQKFNWNKKKLWEFLYDPEKMFVDTTMSLDGIKDPFILASVIDYLQYLRVFTADNKRNVI